MYTHTYTATCILEQNLYVLFYVSIQSSVVFTHLLKDSDRFLKSNREICSPIAKNCHLLTLSSFKTNVQAVIFQTMEVKSDQGCQVRCSWFISEPVPHRKHYMASETRNIVHNLYVLQCFFVHFRSWQHLVILIIWKRAAWTLC